MSVSSKPAAMEIGASPVLSDAREDHSGHRGDDDYEIDSTAAMPQKKKQRPLNLTIPELLALRQEHGTSPRSLPPYARPRRLDPSILSSKIAWNPSRLQNMILACGPGTPAALIDINARPPAAAAGGGGAESAQEHDGAAAAASSGSSSSSSSSCSDEEEDSSVFQQEIVSPPEEPPEPTQSRSGSSSTSSTAAGAKRTLSDRRTKVSEKEAKEKHGVSVSLAACEDDSSSSSSSSSSNNDADHHRQDAEAKTKGPQNAQQSSKRERWTKKGSKEENDESMEGSSDVEEEIHRIDEEMKSDKSGDHESDEEEDHKGNVEDNTHMETDAAEEESEAEHDGPVPRSRQNISTGDDAGEDNESGDDDEVQGFREIAAEWFAMEQAEAEAAGDSNTSGIHDDGDDGDDDDGSEDNDVEAERIIIRRRVLRSRSPTPRAERNNRRTMKPALRHGGCINTAAWLQAGWRLSTVSSGHYNTSFNASVDTDGAFHLHALLSDDCPTQLVTSGDDRLVKFWDVRHAMGTANPLPWGRNTHCPFASSSNVVDGYRAKWSEFYQKQKPVDQWKVPGNVLPLASLNTGHRGNVFHVTPLWRQPGKVATCGADGYLRLGDLEAGSSGDYSSASIVISPEYFDDLSDHMMSGLFSLRPGMCFSHHFLNSNVGLLCSERGLRKFDIRLPPRQQERTALLGGSTSCKACAIWSVSSATSVEEVDSTYVFVGGTGSDVALVDLRMAGADPSSEGAKIIQQYRPRCFTDNNDNVSVSGLDLSRDKKELLVSYESDQIYTFPIFPYEKSAAGPTLEEIGGHGAGASMVDDDNAAALNGSSTLLNGAGQRQFSREGVFLNELAAYGGHLNRFTFLKNAKYAGPNDEYICTGSDSGHAWIYERSTGAVASLLNADHSTCNGVVPHPSLPFFITYGIDSTAKLWRGTRPVDPNADDSPVGRGNNFKQGPYEMSPLAREWESIQQEIASLQEDVKETEAAREADSDRDGEDSQDGGHGNNVSSSFGLLPDQVLSRKELVHTGSFGRSILRRFYTPGGGTGTRIGNDLHSLPDVLRRNQYECIRAVMGGSYGRRHDYPIESDLKELMRRVSLHRLRYQADRLGISGHWNPSLPWIMGSNTTANADEGMHGNETSKAIDSRPAVHPADLIPDNPSDWIPYDPEMSPTARPCGINFNTEEYGDFYGERYLHSDKKDWGRNVEDQTGLSWIWSKDGEEEDDVRLSSLSASENALRILYETARVLKDGGNEALRNVELETAARRYDKAIRYCAVAFIPEHSTATFSGENKHDVEVLERRLADLDISPGFISPMMMRWTPLLKVLISTRLNLSMLLLKKSKSNMEFLQPERAADQAIRALRELQPFCVEKGKIILRVAKNESDTKVKSTSKKSPISIKVLRRGEPEDNFVEAKKLQAKAFFRLGSAEAEMGDFEEAIKSYEISIDYSLELDPHAKPDPLVSRRLAEAKREKRRKRKRHRKKFRKMFEASQHEEDQGDDSNDENNDEEAVAQVAQQTVRDILDDRRDPRQGARQHTVEAAVVTPPTPCAVARTSSHENERATQSE